MSILNKAAEISLCDAAEGGTLSVATSASAEVDLGAEGIYFRFYAVGGDVYLSCGPVGAVTNPAVSGATQGLRIPDGEERDFVVPYRNGASRIKHIGSAAATLVWKPVSP